MTLVNSLHQVSLAVQDMDQAVVFYQEVLHLNLIARFDFGVKLAFFDLKGARLMLEQNEESDAGSLCYFGVDDIEAAVNQVESTGAEVVQTPHVIHHDAEGTFGPAGESEVMAFVRDVSGNLIAFVQRRLEESA